MARDLLITSRTKQESKHNPAVGGGSDGRVAGLFVLAHFLFFFLAQVGSLLNFYIINVSNV